jgi:PAS domain S-box-containing protein
MAHERKAEVEQLATFPEGGPAAPRELSPDHIAQFTAQYSSFNEVIVRLEAAYGDLLKRHEAVQEELASVNERLREAVVGQAATTAYLQNILGSLSSGVICVDLEGRVTHFNPAAERIFGLGRTEVLGRAYRDVLPADAPSAYGALRGPHADMTGEKIYAGSDGRNLPLAVATSLLRSEAGSVDGAVEIVNDLSRLRSLESEVLRVKTLAALGEMAATVAHEIRNPLGGIAGFAALLARDLAADDPRRATAEKVVRGCENLNRIVTNLLQYARPLRLERRHCDLERELADEVSLVEQDLTRHERSITIRRCFADGPVHGFADPVQIRLALHNLLLNAADANGQGEIETGMAEDRSPEGKRELRVWVTDRGPGIPEAHRERVFTPFFTTKDKGTGLGLATVRKVMDAHRGKIDYTQPPGGGTRFELRFPVE